MFRRAIAAVAASVLMLALFAGGCSSQRSNAFVGKWKGETAGSGSLVIADNGAWVNTYEGRNYSGEYKQVDDATLAITSGPPSMQGTTMTMQDGRIHWSVSGDKEVFSKADADTSSSQNQRASGGPTRDSLVGRWADADSPQSFVLELAGDGTFKTYAGDGTWVLSGNRLEMTVQSGPDYSGTVERLGIIGRRFRPTTRSRQHSWSHSTPCANELAFWPPCRVGRWPALTRRAGHRRPSNNGINPTPVIYTHPIALSRGLCQTR